MSSSARVPTRPSELQRAMRRRQTNDPTQTTNSCARSGSRAQSLGLRFQGPDFRVWGLGSRV
eukprot:1363897-Rhodomonas_salina.3